MSNCVKESENNPDQVHCKELTKDEKVALFKNRVYVPPENDSNEKEIFYFVREPSMRTKNVFGQQYIDFLNFMEGKANTIIIDSYCYEGRLVLDGSFKVDVDYDERLEITGGRKNIKTAEKIRFLI